MAAAVDTKKPSSSDISSHHEKNILLSRLMYYVAQFYVTGIFLHLCDVLNLQTMVISAIFHTMFFFRVDVLVIPPPFLVHVIFTFLTLLTTSHHDATDKEMTIVMIAFLWMTSMSVLFHVAFTYSRRNFAELMLFNAVDALMHLVIQFALSHLFSEQPFHDDLQNIFMALKISIMMRILAVVIRLYRDAKEKAEADEAKAVVPVSPVPQPAAAAVTHILYDEGPYESDFSTDDDDKEEEENEDQPAAKVARRKEDADDDDDADVKKKTE